MTRNIITHGLALRMHEVYSAGVTMESVAERFGCSKSSVQRAFADWGLPVRNQGSPRRQTIDVRSIVHRVPERQFHWCQQCERRVTAQQAEDCSSRWCKAKAVAA